MGVVVMLLFLSFCAIFFFRNDPFYLGCPADAMGGACYNSLYHNCRGVPDFYSFTCEIEILNAGESYGEPVPFWLLDSHIIVLLFLGGLFLFNHLKYNRRWKK